MRHVTARDTKAEIERLAILALFARMDTVAMSIALAVACALGLALATAVLLIAGAPPGVPVGPNLSGLGTFLPGYRVNWPGTLVGAGYGALIGAVAGFAIGTFWNFAHLVFLGTAALRRPRRPETRAEP